MSKPTSAALSTPGQERQPSRVPVWLFVLFFFSGVSGLLYEVVWVRMLTRVLGSTVYATSTVLAAFMAGLALGSFAAGRWIDRSRRPLAWYVVMEAGVGFSALASLVLPERLVPVYRWVFESAGGSRAWLTSGQVAIALVVLLVPTALMGATLPALSAVVVRCRGSFGPALARLYGANTLGGVVGVLAAGFVLLGEVGETWTILIGAGLNFAVGLAGLVMLRRWRTRPTPMLETALASEGQLARAAPTIGTNEHEPSYSETVRRVVLLCFATNGFVALATEVIWSRMLLLYQGTSVYAFSAMLAVVLACISLGSLLISMVIDRLGDPLTWLARLHLASALAGGLALQLFDLIGFLGRPELSNPREIHLMTMVLAPIILLGPTALVWGAIFPVSARCYAAATRGAGQSVADLYAWNTVGCIAGSFVAGFVLIPRLGSAHGAITLVACSLLSGLVLSFAHPGGLKRRGPLLNWGLVGATVLLVATAGDPYYGLIKQRLQTMFPRGLRLYRHVEEAAGTTTAFGNLKGDPDAKRLWVNGEGMTELLTSTKLMAHLPIWLVDNPRDALVVCFGMGTTVRSALTHPGIQVWAVELVPSVVDCFGFYHADGPAVLKKPNLRVVIDDGRNFLLMHSQQFDVITVDPPPPLYSAGTVNLYSKEFLELCQSRLRPGGTICLWLPPTNWPDAKMILRTFVEVFKNASVWRGPDYPGFFLCGSDRPKQDIVTHIRQSYAIPAVLADLNEWDSFPPQPEKILELYVCNGERMRRFLEDAPVITDDRAHMEFPLWRACLDHKRYPVFLNAPILEFMLSNPEAADGFPEP